MAARRRRQRLKKRTRRQLQIWGTVATLFAVVWVARNWSVVWPVLVTVLAAAVAGGAGWVPLRAHRLTVGQDRAWRAQEEAGVRELSMAEVDALSWQDFEGTSTNAPRAPRPAKGPAPIHPAPASLRLYLSSRSSSKRSAVERADSIRLAQRWCMRFHERVSRGCFIR